VIAVGELVVFVALLALIIVGAAVGWEDVYKRQASVWSQDDAERR